jgi:error-prone DNA polymerase
MDDRFIIEWDKDDIEALGILKIDVLALGILTCIRKSLSSINSRRISAGQNSLQLSSIPIDDPDTYAMMCKSDTMGVFQIESRAQMAMLPRVKPRCYYDVVIEIALVRPGPIHGNMVHPYLRRREGIEKVAFPDDKVRSILGKTLGIPLFQEQAMRLAIVLAGFTPGEAEQLRRAMGAWKRHEHMIDEFRQRIVAGMRSYGYSQEFAQTCMDQIKGFSEYGFPESHAASFAYLVIASAWLKCHYPAEFAAALLNSQPMGFYGPSQILDDAKRHSIILDPVDINRSCWEYVPSPDGSRLQIGFQCIKGFQRSEAQKIVLLRDLAGGSFDSIEDLWSISLAIPEELQLTYGSLVSLARSGAFSSLGMTIRQALWKVKELPRHPEWITDSDYLQVHREYQTKCYSTEVHLVSFSRDALIQEFNCVTWKELTNHEKIPAGRFVAVGGIVISRQRPPTAKGVVFLSIEDETGIINIIVPKYIFERYPNQAMFEQSLVVRGKVQRIGAVNYIIASELRSFSMFNGNRWESAPLGPYYKSYTS